MKISKSVIEKLDPCTDRLDNYSSHYGEQDFTIDEFFLLDKISLGDKMWVAFRLMSTKHVIRTGLELASSVLHLYENRCPGDLRPRKAIESALSREITEDILNASYSAAHAAHADYYAAHADYSAYSAYYAAHAAYYAAYAAHATYSAAHAASDFVTKRAYSAAVNGVTAVRYDTNHATYKDALEKEQLSIILKYWKESVNEIS